MRQRLDEKSDAAPGSAATQRVGDRLDGRLDVDVGTTIREAVRPAPVHPVGERVREWIEWFGITRLLTSAVAVVVVCTGAWLLVRTPSPPSEADLPVAQAAGDVPSTPLPTLPVATASSDPLPTDTERAVIVHVAGAVGVPGVYELGADDRIDDAVRVAGGPTDVADLGRINLAAPVVDGGQIYVPEFGEAVALPPPEPISIDAEATSAAPVDVNRASAVELETLPGVGPATAAAIVTERDLNGPFASFEDLERVPGIGPAKLAALDGLVVT